MVDKTRMVALEEVVEKWQVSDTAQDGFTRDAAGDLEQIMLAGVEHHEAVGRSSGEGFHQRRPYVAAGAGYKGRVSRLFQLLILTRERVRS
jgi:hypothetical protein